MLKRTAQVVTTSHTKARESKRKFARSMAGAFVLMLALAGHSFAQTFRGTILGTVTDPNGAVVPNATVTAKNVGTGIERTTTADAFGNYTLAELQIGTYELKVQGSGFQTATVSNVVVEV